MSCEQIIEARMDVLYGEANRETKRRVRAHLANCRSCREEMQAFQHLRNDLGAWTLPGPRRVDAPFWQRLGASLAAAAVLLVALGGALAWARAEIRYQDGRFFARFGRHTEAEELQRLLAEQEQRHRAAISERREALVAAAVSQQPMEASALLQQVQVMIEASERRQERNTIRQFALLTERSDAQRRLDLARISAGLSYLDGQAGQHMARTSELMGYVLETSQTR